MKKIILFFLFTLFVHSYSISQVITSYKNIKIQKILYKVYVFEETGRYSGQ